MRKAALLGVIGCLVGLGSLVSAQEVKIGYVNLQRVKETEEWKRLEGLVAGEISKFELEVEQKKKELEAAALQYQRQKSMLSEDAQRTKESELQRQKLESQLWVKDRQEALEKKRDDMTQQFWSRVHEVVGKIAKDKGLTLVINYDPSPSSVTVKLEKGFIYAAPGMDMTDEVIQAVNALFK